MIPINNWKDLLAIVNHINPLRLSSPVMVDIDYNQDYYPVVGAYYDEDAICFVVKKEDIGENLD